MKPSDELGVWLNNAAKYPLLSKSETLQLSTVLQDWLLEQKGSERAAMRAKNRLVKGNMRLVVKGWRLYFSYVSNNDPKLIDLLQEGSFGLIRAVERFDPKRGYEFSTYAMPWIRQSIIRWFHQKDRMMRLSSSCHETVVKVRRLQENSLKRTGKAMTMDELVTHVECGKETLEFYLERWNNTQGMSLDYLLKLGKQDDSISVIDKIADTNEYEWDYMNKSEELGEVVERLIAKADLDPMTIKVLKMKYMAEGKGKHLPTYTEISKELGLEGRKANNMALRAMEKLRAVVKQENLEASAIL